MVFLQMSTFIQICYCQLKISYSQADQKESTSLLVIHIFSNQKLKNQQQSLNKKGSKFLLKYTMDADSDIEMPNTL